MALRAFLGVDNNVAISGQTVRFTLTVTNPTGGTDTQITQIAPTLSPAKSATTVGRPLLNIPEAPYFLAAGQSVVFTWQETFRINQIPVAQSNVPTGSFPMVAGANVYASDGTITSPATVDVLVYPNVGVNTATAFTVPSNQQSCLFYVNTYSDIVGALQSARAA